MKYKCNACKEIFTHPAKLVESYVNVKEDIERLYSMTTTDEKVPLHQDWEDVHTLARALKHRIIDGDVETYCCPFCHEKSFSEWIEPEADITSVLSCDLSAVDGFLKQGYIVKELYAKTATLVKREVPKKEQPDPDDNQAITESNDVTDPFVQQARAYYAKMHPEVKTE
jgi:hypothetical protein